MQSIAGPLRPLFSLPRRLSHLLLGAGVGLACRGGTEPRSAAGGLHVSATGLVLAVGDTMRLGATWADSLASYTTLPGRGVPWPAEVPVEWTSGDNRVVRVAAAGLVTAAGPGTTWITVVARGLRDTAAVRVSPGAEAPGAVFTEVTAGLGHTCALAVDRHAACWGDEWHGATGGGAVRRFTAKLSPAWVAGGLTFTALDAGGFNTCGLTADGAAYCWGDDLYNQLGTAEWAPSAVPVRVQAPAPFTALRVGGNHACALTAAGAVYCWGMRAPLEPGVPVPTRVGVPGTVTQLAAGGAHDCALRADGAAFCWGNNLFGQLGTPGEGPPEIPVNVGGGFRFVAISAGGAHTCALDETGVAYCWGDNAEGQLGWNDGASTAVPVPVSGGVLFAQVGAASQHTCALGVDSAVYCWGSNALGELGDGGLPGIAGGDMRRWFPTRVAGLSSVQAITEGDGRHTCALTSDGLAYCWGSNGLGELGYGRFDQVTTSGRVARSTATPVAAIR